MAAEAPTPYEIAAAAIEALGRFKAMQAELLRAFGPMFGPPLTRAGGAAIVTCALKRAGVSESLWRDQSHCRGGEQHRQSLDSDTRHDQ